MNGVVDEAGRALLTLSVRPATESAPKDVAVWVDTAFDGELVMPEAAIKGLGLKQSAAVKATLADGNQVVLETFHCLLEWFGTWRQIEVVANVGKLPLLGIGLLRGRKLTVDYAASRLALE